MKLTFVLAAGILSSTLALAAADWPQWRGANRDDHSPDTGLLKSWPQGGPALAWKTTGLGGGFAGVALKGERIFTMGERGTDSFLIALDRATGKKLWETKVGRSGAPGWGGFAGPRCTPATDGERIVTVSQYGEILCANVADGKEVWRAHMKDFGGELPEWGFSESPLLDGAKVVITPGGAKGAVVALDFATGKLLWQSANFTDPAHYSSVVIATIGGVRHYVQLTEKSVVGIDPEKGALLWKAPRKGATAVIPTPIVADDHVYVTSGYGIGCNLFKVTKSGDKFSAEQVYANKNMANHHGGVIKVGDHLYGHSEGKGWVCQEFKTGNTVWDEKEKLQKGSVTLADGRLYCREELERGVVALIEATPDGYKETGRFTPPDRSGKKSWPHPVVIGGRLYLRDQDVLLCYDVKAK